MPGAIPSDPRIRRLRSAIGGYRRRQNWAAAEAAAHDLAVVRAENTLVSLHASLTDAEKMRLSVALFSGQVPA